MKVYTRRGDEGQTDLFGGARVAKSDSRVEAYGAVDELNAFVGVAACSAQADLVSALERIQRTLFQIGAALARDPERAEREAGSPGANEAEVADLEAAIDLAQSELPALKAFVLPGGTPAAAAFHAARVVCRRAERRVVALGPATAPDDATLRYLNRLSDLFFVWARLENRRAGVADVEWSDREG